MKLLKKMLKSEHFKRVFSKLVSDTEMDDRECEYILSCAQMIVQPDIRREYGQDALDLSYYILLKYSICYRDYQPLYDISVNMGYYPTSSFILNKNMLPGSLLDHLQNSVIESEYSLNGHTVTKDQLKVHNRFMSSKLGPDCSVVAPTSYGKSRMMLDHISKSMDDRIAVIVPTRSLLAQTYRNIRDLGIERKILLHEGMYDGNGRFVAVMTQERALRLFDENPDLSFNSMYIDEAQNLLPKNNRAILLSRLISLARKRNPNCRLIYLSPTLCDSNNLIIDPEYAIDELRITQNMKRLSVFEYDGVLQKTYCPDYKTVADIKQMTSNYIQYIIETGSERNYIYLNSPRKVELFSKELYDALDYSTDPELSKVVSSLEKNLDPRLKIIDYLKKGILYLHGHIPDEIKEYLEVKYIAVRSIRFLVANTVILEGMNLPIQTIYILNTDNLSDSNLINLTGRANRLNYVFGTDGNISRLISNIHFVKSHYAKSNGVMSNFIKRLGKPKDDVKNPILKRNTCKKEEQDRIRNLEQVMFETPLDEYKRIKQRIVSLGICYEYEHFSDDDCKTIVDNIHRCIDKIKRESDIFELIQQIFINNLENKTNPELNRMKNDKAKKYYRLYFNRRRFQSIKDNISDDINHYKNIIENGDSLLYVTEKFGEISKNGGKRKLYVNLSDKSYSDMVNYSMIIQKNESDYVSYHLVKLFKFLREMDLLDEKEYNYYVFGTRDISELHYVQSGLSISTINYLKKHNQMCNLHVDSNNVIHGNRNFRSFIQSLDDYNQFLVTKFIKLDE
ncbi:MAG: DEAD/DEAH box helicase [Candidatus Methanomethylophilaceae archaeon]|nr:DEAD/DEAH box helicase [Candidatus Methanomethylophilaceae archaeon]